MQSFIKGDRGTIVGWLPEEDGSEIRSVMMRNFQLITWYREDQKDNNWDFWDQIWETTDEEDDSFQKNIEQFINKKVLKNE